MAAANSAMAARPSAEELLGGAASPASPDFALLAPEFLAVTFPVSSPFSDSSPVFAVDVFVVLDGESRRF